MKTATKTRCCFILCAVLALLLWSSCSTSVFYHHYRSVPSEGWEHGDTVLFIVDTVPSSANYQFELGIRTTPKFPFQKLWLVIDRQFTNPDTVSRDTIECVLATPEGNITGKGVSLYSYAFRLPPMYLQQGQTGHIIVSHIMRSDLLTGVSDIGIKIQK